MANILFGCNFRKSRTMTRKFCSVFELHRFVLHMKNLYCIVHRSFYRGIQKFQCINIFVSFLMPQISTKFWYVFILHISDLHTKMSHSIQHIFYREYLESPRSFRMFLNYIDFVPKFTQKEEYFNVF